MAAEGVEDGHGEWDDDDIAHLGGGVGDDACEDDDEGDELGRCGEDEASDDGGEEAGFFGDADAEECDEDGSQWDEAGEVGDDVLEHPADAVGREEGVGGEHDTLSAGAWVFD